MSTVARLAGEIARREVSPVEAMAAVIERIEARNPSLNAFVHLGLDEAMERAGTAEQEVMDGESLGPLHGVPTAMKDGFDFRPGWPSTFGGIPALKDFVVQHRCLWAERMEEAGAIIVGKTNAPVLGFSGVCDNPLFGATRNPFDLSRNSGGSSGGSAAAVADGIVLFAEATDAAGSIRIPASWCGIFGFKPGAGRVPVVMRPNAFGTASPFVHEGLVTRTVEDATLCLNALVGYDPRDPYCHDTPRSLAVPAEFSLRECRIAFSPNLDVCPVEPGVAQLVAEAARAFEEAGAHVEVVQLGIELDHNELPELYLRIASSLTLEVLDALKHQGIDLLVDHPDQLPEPVIESAQTARQMTVPQLSADQIARSQLFDAVQGTFNRYDLLITPTVGLPAVQNGERGRTREPSEVNGVSVNPTIGWTMTYLFNLTGHPVASVPIGLLNGLPVGMQIVGRRLREVDVLAASGAFESIRPWHDTYPQVG